MKVFISGKFKVIHTGHMRLFRFAQELGGDLVVGLDVTSLGEDEKKWRRGILENLEYVSSVVEFSGEVVNIIREIEPDIVLKGQEFKGKVNAEENVLREFGGKLVFTAGSNFFTETDLIQESSHRSLAHRIEIPLDFTSRNNVSREKLSKVVESFRSLKVCVIGDLIIDEYINCHPLGMSQESPSIVVTPIDSKRFFGGAGIVAAHCQSLGADTTLITVMGKDEISSWSKRSAEDYGVKLKAQLVEGRQTTLKQRYLSGSQVLLRVSHLSQNLLDEDQEKLIVEQFREICDKLDVLIFSDFSYGVLSPWVVANISKIASEKGILVSADSQSSSQMGDLSKYCDLDLITATEHEARVELKDYSSGVAVIAEKLRLSLKSESVFLKMGPDGILISSQEPNGKIIETEKIDALNKIPVDNSGAGDSMLAAASMALACDATIQEAALLGSLVAAIQVGRLGNVPIEVDSVLKIIHS